MGHFRQALSEDKFDNATGIDRKHMPQVQSDDMPEFYKFMDKRGVTYKNERITLKKLLPTQDQYNSDKVDGMIKAMSFERLTKKPLFVSSDNRVIDGHHRYQAARLLKPFGMAKIIRINLPIMQALQLFKEYPKTFYAGINEQAEYEYSLVEETTVISAAPTTQQPNASGEKKKDILGYARKVCPEKQEKVNKLVNEIFESVDDPDVEVSMARLATINIVKK